MQWTEHSQHKSCTDNQDSVWLIDEYNNNDESEKEIRLNSKSKLILKRK